MKTKYWVILFGVLAVVLAACAVLLIPKEGAQIVEIWSEGKLLHTLPLSRDCELEITTDRGSNTVIIQGGKAWVEQADCPDKTCVVAEGTAEITTAKEHGTGNPPGIIQQRKLLISLNVHVSVFVSFC